MKTIVSVNQLSMYRTVLTWYLERRREGDCLSPNTNVNISVEKSIAFRTQEQSQSNSRAVVAGGSRCPEQNNMILLKCCCSRPKVVGRSIRSSPARTKADAMSGCGSGLVQWRHTPRFRWSSGMHVRMSTSFLLLCGRASQQLPGP